MRTLAATAAPYVVGLVVIVACQDAHAPPIESSLKGSVKLVAPVAGGRFQQNDASLGCAAHAARGYGFRTTFDWQDVEGAVAYKIVFWHTGSQFAAVQHDVSESSYDETWCNAFVIDSNLDHWVWRAAAVGASADTLWSEEREYGFEPCRLDGNVPCSAPPP